MKNCFSLKKDVKTDLAIMSILPSISTVDSEVRPEYVRMCKYIQELAGHFGITVNEEKRAEMEIIAKATEVIDRIYDDTRDAAKRTQVRGEILAYLRGESGSIENILIEEALQLIQSVLAQNPDCKERFIHAVEKIFEKTEIIRFCADVQERIHAIIEEGEYAGELEMMMIQNKTPEFEMFMKECVGAGNLIDDVCDAREDYRSGERTSPPTVSFYWHAVGTIFSKIAKIVKLHPQKQRLFYYFAKAVLAIRKYSRSQIKKPVAQEQ